MLLDVMLGHKLHLQIQAPKCSLSLATWIIDLLRITDHRLEIVLNLKSDATVVWMGTAENERVCQLPKLVMWFWPRHKPDGLHVQLQFNSRQFFLWIFRAFRDWGMTTWLQTTASGCVFMGAEPQVLTSSQDPLWHTKLALLPLSPLFPSLWLHVVAIFIQQHTEGQPISGHLILSLQGSGHEKKNPWSQIVHDTRPSWQRLIG